MLTVKMKRCQIWLQHKVKNILKTIIKKMMSYLINHVEDLDQYVHLESEHHIFKFGN